MNTNLKIQEEELKDSNEKFKLSDSSESKRQKSQWKMMLKTVMPALCSRKVTLAKLTIFTNVLHDI